MKFLTATFWKQTVESVLAGFGTGFLGAWAVSDGLNVHDLETAAVAGGALALYSFVKALGGVQAVSAAMKGQTKG